jgi:hypothetical protein
VVDGPRDTRLRSSSRSWRTSSSWLNQIELWFAKIERDIIAGGVFTSLADLWRKLLKYIRHYNKVPKTVKWRYFDPTRRITPSSAVIAH